MHRIVHPVETSRFAVICGIEISPARTRQGSREAYDSSALARRWPIKGTVVGIPAEKQQTIFEAFTQADSSAPSHYHRTGLGLAITATHIVGTPQLQRDEVLVNPPAAAPVAGEQ